MSYEIVRNCKVCFDSDTGTYYAVLKTASNNCYPHDYSEWTYGKLSDTKEYAFKTKEEVEKALLIEFYHGNLQKGNSKYRRVAREIRKHPELLERYDKIDHAYWRVQRRYWAIDLNDAKVSQERIDQIKNLCKKLYRMAEEELKERLYEFMVTHKDEVKTSTKVKPFTIREKGSQYYVRKVTRTKYYTNYSDDAKPTLFTSRALWDRVTTSSWWQERFEITQV